MRMPIYIWIFIQPQRHVLDAAILCHKVILLLPLVQITGKCLNTSVSHHTLQKCGVHIQSSWAQLGLVNIGTGTEKLEAVEMQGSELRE
jgi:hypothetical protein